MLNNVFCVMENVRGQMAVVFIFVPL